MSDQNPTVRVYRNLHRKCYSIQAKVGRGWRVIAHAGSVELEGVTFKVSQAGRDRVLRTGAKAVHAYAVGRLVGWTGYLLGDGSGPLAATLGLPRVSTLPASDHKPVAYNPRRQESFYLVTGSHDREPPVRGCAALRIQPSRLLALAPDLAVA